MAKNRTEQQPDVEQFCRLVHQLKSFSGSFNQSTFYEQTAGYDLFQGCCKFFYLAVLSSEVRKLCKSKIENGRVEKCSNFEHQQH